MLTSCASHWFSVPLCVLDIRFNPSYCISFALNLLFVCLQIKKAEAVAAKESKKATELREHSADEESMLAAKEALIARATTEKDAADAAVESVLQSIMVRVCVCVSLH